MYSTTLALALALSFLQFVLLADAGIYVLKPAAGSTCSGGQTCTVEWLDDGVHPLLTTAGLCTFGLYTGNLQLVQALPPTDVSTTHSITFKPNPAAGPNSHSYYIGIISTTAKDNSSDPFPSSYKAFSPFFSIDQMTGSHRGTHLSFDDETFHDHRRDPLNVFATPTHNHCDNEGVNHLYCVPDEAHDLEVIPDVNAHTDTKCGRDELRVTSLDNIGKQCARKRSADTSSSDSDYNIVVLTAAIPSLVLTSPGPGVDS
ncbi:hypothetical protein DXG01_007330 [Tephrocybe rancida]|nr:hypothetical protein DXG01_007330 [Tephrocybe rancida]